MAELLNFEGEAEAEAGIDTGATGVALALDGARHDPSLRDNIASFLHRQEEFLEKQLHHMQLKHFSERLKVLFQLVTLLVALGLVGAVGLAAWRAYTDHSLVIEGLGAPADFAAQGDTSAALAGQLQDKLAALQEATVTGETAVEVRDKNTPNVKIEIPETGVSLGDVSEALEGWLGHETKVAGDVSRVVGGQDAGALALDLRVGSTPGVRLVQADGDMETLLAKGAEHIYAATQPFRYMSWLDEHGRTPEAIAMARDMTRSADDNVRGLAFSRIAVISDPAISEQEQIDLLRRDQRPNADLVNLGVRLENMGHWQQAYLLFRKATGAKPSPDVSSDANKNRHLIATTDRDYMLGGDMPIYLCFVYAVNPCSGDGIFEAARMYQAAKLKIDSLQAERIFVAARKVADRHDPAASARLLSLPHDVDPNRSAGFNAIIETERYVANVHLDAERQDWPRVLEEAKAWSAFAAPWPGLQYPFNPHLQEALALASLGRGAEADALLAAMPGDCYPCLDMRGRVAAIGRRWADADRWFAEAARQGPSLPIADTHWGQALLAKGDADAAIPHLQKAVRLSPVAADPLEFWGEALLAQGMPGDAAAKFAKAAALTPAWGRLHLKWGEALAKSGKAEEARAQLKTAAGLFLVPADRAELAAQRL